MMMNGKYTSRSTQIGFVGAGGGHDDCNVYVTCAMTREAYRGLLRI